METIIIYTIKVSIAIAMFYALHMLFLRNDTFFKIRRAYFNIALLFSLLYPFVTFQTQQTQKGGLAMPAYMMTEVEVFVKANTAVMDSTASGLSIFSILFGIIVIGIAAQILRFIIQLVSLLRTLHKSGEGEIITLEDKKTPSFSFFNYIVVNTYGKTESQINDIIKHEMAHMKQWHSVDTLAYNLFCIFFWWNPFAWLMKNEVKLNLEYLADEEAISQKEDYKE